MGAAPGPQTDGPRRPGRPREPAADTAIVTAALDLLAERGFAAATIEAIASRARVGRNTIYRRWSSKEELFADALHGLISDFALDTDDLRELLSLWIHDFARTIADPLHGRLLTAVLGELDRNPEFARAYAERVVQPRRRALLVRLEDAQARGEIRADVAIELVADLVGGPLVLHVLPLGLPGVHDEYAEQLLEVIWRGIAPAFERPPQSS